MGRCIRYIIQKLNLLIEIGRVIRKFKGHDQRVNCLAFNYEIDVIGKNASEACSVLVTGSYDKTVKIWDLKSHNYEPIHVIPTKSIY